MQPADGWPGREIDGAENKTYPQRQVELGLQHAKSQLIWVPQSLDIQTIEDEAHRDFLDRLEKGKRDLTGYRLIREPQSEIARQIVCRLEELEQGRPRRTTPPPCCWKRTSKINCTPSTSGGR